MNDYSKLGYGCFTRAISETVLDSGIVAMDNYYRKRALCTVE